jgi:hypothetical protein
LVDACRRLRSLERDTACVLERGVDRNGQSNAHDPAWIPDGAIHEHRAHHRLVGHEDVPAFVGDERRVRERDGLDHARVVAHRNAVTEANGLGECEENPRAEIAERRRQCEARDEGEHGA